MTGELEDKHWSSPNYDVTTELFNAVNNNDLFCLQEVLLESPNMDVNQAVIGSMTALHVAAEKGYSSCVKVLLSAGADIDCKDEHGCTALMNAIASGHPLVVVSLLRARCNCNLASHTHTRALHLSSRQGSHGITQLLLVAGADPNVSNLDGHTPLSIAVEAGHTAVVQALLLGCNYIDPNTMTTITPTRSPLTLSLEKGKFLLAKTLLLAGFRGFNQVRRYLDNLPEGLEFNNHTEKESFRSIQTLANHPLSLQALCRLTIRHALGFNIEQKSPLLTLPSSVLDYLCFQDMYSAPCLQTANDVYCFFNDHAREVY